jgi:hypothetical protein
MYMDYMENMRNPWSVGDYVDVQERDCVCAVVRAAEELETVLRQNEDFSGLTPSGRVVLNRCYREMKRTVEVYLNDNENPLTYQAPAPGTPFAKKEAK